MRLPGVLPDREATSNDEWWTPPYIIDGIGLTYDLDPAAPPGGVPWIPAAHHYTEADDGLTMPWYGRVWLNPPYSTPWPWVARLAEHGNGVALIPADTATRGFQRYIPGADAVLFLRGRVTFLQPDNANVTSARFASALAAWGSECANAVGASRLGWVVHG